MIIDFKTDIKLNLKNIYGWRNNRKIVVFSVDDYGNVRVDSKKARERMDKTGLKVFNRFDAFDSLETREDLEMLFEVLSSKKDKNGKNAVFTLFSVPCNIDFEKMAEENYQCYHYELLPDTFCKLASLNQVAYHGTWKLFIEGITKGLVAPQFHGREHFNLKVFEEKMQKKEKEILIALSNRSYTSIPFSGYKTISYTAAFDFWNFDENLRFNNIIKDGLDAFETVYGYRAIHFNPPGGREHPVIHHFLKSNGIKYLDTPFIKREHSGLGKYKTKINYTGEKNPLNMIYMVRNVVFEPTENIGIDWVNFTLKQIDAAFRWNRPAIISSHRVNFCGHIDARNRDIGLTALKELLNKIVQKWPDVEFMAANHLGELIAKK